MMEKRWKNLWTQLPHLIFLDEDDITEFRWDDTGFHDYIAFIDNILYQCPTDLSLKKFKLSINYSNRDVGVGQEEFTFEDELIFKTSCIMRMTLSCCRFNPPNGVISWERLECLCLYYVTLDKDMIEKILFGSPCLESLELKNRHGYRRIDITSRSVNKLVFSDYYYRNEEDYIDCIKINAPYISSLTIKGEFEVELVLLDVSSLIKAELDYCIDTGILLMLAKKLLTLHRASPWALIASRINNIHGLELDFLSSSADIIQWCKASCVKEVDRIEKQFDDFTDVLFGLVAFHWMVRDTPMSYHHHRLTNIVSLDLTNETYREVSMPPLYGDKCDGGISLRTLGEWLCVIVHYKGICADL
ncbi:ribonuclease H-like domain-containing protein [Tanacetum coccineum]